jgi:hypothetical protein
MAVDVQGPDGKTYHFPAGTTKEAAIGYFKKKGIGVAKPAAASSAAPAQEEGTLTKVGRGSALGTFEGMGIKPATGRKEVLTGTAKQLGKSITDLAKETWEANKASGRVAGPVGQAAATALDIIPTVIDKTATSLEQGGRQAIQDIKNKDWESAAEHAASTITQALMLKEAGEGKAALSKDSLTSVSKQGTQAVIQKFVHDRALKIQDHLSEVQKAVKADDAARWQHIEQTIDEARPEGSIDMTGLRTSTRDTVEGTIKTPQKLPETVKNVQKGSETPRVGGDRLDLSNPSHKALYDRLKESGAFPSEDVVSFGTARQMRSKLGRELRSRSSSLSGESKAVGWKLYGDLTDAMKSAAAEHGLEGSFQDANKFHSKYMDDWGPDSVLGKAVEGTNAHDVLSEISSPKHAEEIRRVMNDYRKHGMDPEAVGREGKVFQKLGSGLPQQLPFSRWEAMTYALRPEAGPIYTGSREAFNWFKRDQALKEVQKPNPIAVRSQALKAAAEKLGSKASVKEIMAEADKSTVQQ